MMKKDFRFSMVSLILCLVCAFFAAAAGQQDTEESITERKLSIAWGENYSGVAETPVWKQIQKDTGITIDFQIVPGADYQTSIQTRIASGQKLPDIFLPLDSPVKLYQNGVILALNELVDQHAPNIKRLLDERPEFKTTMMTQDGKLVVASAFGGSQANPKTEYFHKDWAEKLGMDTPTTTEEFFDLMKAFVDNKDVLTDNPDEFLCIAIENFGVSVRTIAGGFGLHLFTEGWHYDFESGQVTYDPLRPEYRDFLEYLNAMYAAGILPQEVIVSNTVKKAMFSKNVIGYFSGGIGMVQIANRGLKEAGLNSTYALMPPLESPDGERKFDIRASLVAKTCNVISADCADPVLAIEFIDYVWASEEGQRTMMYGIEGLSYELDDNGEPQWTDYMLNNPDGKAFWTLINELRGNPLQFMRYTNENYISIFKNQPYEYDLIKTFASYQADKPSFPNILGTVEQEERFSSYATDVYTYVDEMSFKFVTGEEPFSNYDKFVATLNKLGAPEMIKIKQEQINAVLGN